MSLGKKLRNLRNERGFTQEQLAEQFDVTRQTISRWELDQVLPETAKLLEIASFFHASLDDLLLEKEENKKEISSQPLDEEETKEILSQPLDEKETKIPKFFRLSKFRKLQLGGILFLTVLLLWNPANNGTPLSPINLIDSSFIIILILTLAVSLLFKAIFRQKVKLPRLIAVCSVCIGFVLSGYYFVELLRLGDFNHGLRIILLPLYYGILLGFAFSQT